MNAAPWCAGLVVLSSCSAAPHLRRSTMSFCEGRSMAGTRSRQKASAARSTSVMYWTSSVLVILAVGEKKEILLGHPNHSVTLKSLAGDRVVELPLRDPMTMKSMAQ